jgi:hypothetical protein
MSAAANVTIHASQFPEKLSGATCSPRSARGA